MYAVDGMGSPEAATVERTTGQRCRGLWSVPRGERSLPYIGTCIGADAEETPAMKARNARNEGLEMPILKST
jgi:hypothetical protein